MVRGWRRFRGRLSRSYVLEDVVEFHIFTRGTKSVWFIYNLLGHNGRYSPRIVGINNAIPNVVVRCKGEIS